MISLIILLLVLLGIALRKLGPIMIPIWVIMLLGALLVLITLQISPLAAIRAIDFNVIAYLFGVFVIGQALENSGYLEHLGYYCFRLSHNPSIFLLLIIFISGLASAFLMNDTLAIIGTPLILLIAKHSKIDAKPYLLALAFAITLGSVMSPIGNPQNLLIAAKGNFQQPFIAFMKMLSLPSLICLLIAYVFILLRYQGRLRHHQIQMQKPRIKNRSLMRLSQLSLILLLLLIFLKILGSYFAKPWLIHFSAIALIAAAPILLFSQQRLVILKQMDWHTLIFFAALFVLVQSVWDTGYFQSWISQSQLGITDIPTILGISALMSQLISNVPLVALYLPMLLHAHASQHQLLALSAGSTVAGNFLIMGAASNIIIIQNAEKRKHPGFSFLEFAILGVPLGFICLIIYGVFLR